MTATGADIKFYPKHAMRPGAGKKTVAALLIIIGLVVFAAGLYGYLAGDLQSSWFDLPEIRQSVMDARKVAQSEGVGLTGTMGVLSTMMNTAVILMIFGGLMIYIAIMLLTQPWERFKDFACVVPVVAFFLIFVYYPMVDLLRISFTNWNLIRDDYGYVGLKNYTWLFAGSGFKYLVESLRITVTYTIWEIIFTLAGGMLLAMLFDRMSRGFTVLRTFVFMPRYIGVSTSAIVFIWILNGRYGILNHVIALFGGQGPDWLLSESTALTGVLFLTFWRVTGYGMMIYLSAMKGIPQDYYEAAEIDGADGPQRFRFITLPMLAPTTLFLLITTFIASMKVFMSVDVMTGGGPGRATNVMVQWVYNTAFRDFRVDRAAAISLVFFVILLLATAATMRYSVNRVSYDS
ncbi:MAG: sugar ABC transporter permease [Eubacteriales bacterium]|nr:sugar ABC transporter permease [Eubacteriales bacterium]MDD4104415.1 sugar ABC transporter permease [Eubacteriales bacterium]MDD4709638.1 sugar ABC transporter permease [Eubacteriales bacterium]